VAMAAVEDVAAAGRADPAPPAVVLAPAHARANNKQKPLRARERATERKIERDAGEKKQQQQHGYGPEAHPGEAAALLGGVLVHGRREGAALRRSGEEQSRSGQVRSGREEERLPRPRSWGRGGGGRVFL
jgi:hypothetical protein